MFKLGQDIKDLEAILTNLPEEDVDSQLAITRVSLESLEALEATASDLESQLNDGEQTKDSEWTSLGQVMDHESLLNNFCLSQESSKQNKPDKDSI